MSTLMGLRVADAKRLRNLWKENQAAFPEISLAMRLKSVTTEFMKRAPSGKFLYLASFKNSQPSERWIRAALLGRMVNGSGEPEFIGEPLIPQPVRVYAKRGGLTLRVHALESWARSISEQLGVPFDVKESSQP